ncbi:hypothetical protein JS528_02410 [Bifidobacterium sp. MA2]|uniref:Lipoprotein n=1 Tax=Bifidobacterium santillanense TaxID=2809028 RepID=A0ABS5UMX0_9BIFI|nr:hypothetical protein [Bifidobacterium santillanense]MBT1172231.1 hypothetical protein [Bifidobacterium santillanense]
MATHQGRSSSGDDAADSASNARSAETCSKATTVQGEIVVGDCTRGGEGTVALSKGLLALYEALKSSVINDEQVFVGGKYKGDQQPDLMLTSAMDNLGSGRNASAANGLASLLGEDDAAAFYQSLVPSDTASIYMEDTADYKKRQSIEDSFPWYRAHIAGYGDFVYRIGFLIKGAQSNRIVIGVTVYDTSSVPSTITVQESKPAQTESDGSSDQGTPANTQKGQSVDTDFNDLWTSVVVNENLSRIAGKYCRKDGACVSINANGDHVAGDYSTNPGTIGFVSGDSSLNPLPQGASTLDLSFAYQQQDTPTSAVPIDLQTMTTGCDAASDASCVSGVSYVASNAKTDEFSERISSGNPPDTTKDYLVIGWTTEVSDSTVFYRQE